MDGAWDVAFGRDADHAAGLARVHLCTSPGVLRAEPDVLAVWSEREQKFQNLESLRWTSTYNDEDMATLKVGDRGKTWDLPFREVFDILGNRFHCDWQGVQGAVGGGTSSYTGQREYPCLLNAGEFIASSTALH